ncbi:glycerophosphodiester phosphodiesterase [Nonomuraea glycinis]|uniref:glycerophosphodiester phosphodiesterase n=1 Tax=Nonomuraea glycinis TaxID=2047744 RepID=A0A918E989_9ACTN|nr:glycerophosphodiester phosphodiesterase [Nonomuraea glycinis]MCA2182519.1 glycerophosphodiester phosphodiesterase [Nonomuraea glycinis]GGP16337.1 glycerophosphoryl diester phosphodiesterase [Nonomuraea glycinis]
MRKIAVTTLAVLVPLAGAGAAPAAAQPRPDRSEVVVIGHRGSAGHRPEHTQGGYELAVAMGADWIEPDLVPTKDHVLVVRHENEISGTTDVSLRPEFAARKTTKVIDGRNVTGWFTEDFTLAELKTLRAVERLPAIRQRNTVYNGYYQVLTFQEVLDLAKKLRHRYGREVGVFPETKHPTYFRSIGLPLEEPLIETIKRNGLNRPNSPVVVQSFEPSSLKRVAKDLRVPLWQALGTSGRPYDLTAAGDPTTYADMMKPEGLAKIAEYAKWIGPDKSSAIPLQPDGSWGTPTTLVSDAHKAGLKIGLYTFRSENQYLPAQLRRGQIATDHGDALAEYRAHLDLGADAFVTDYPDTAALARSERGKPHEHVQPQQFDNGLPEEGRE